MISKVNQHVSVNSSVVELIKGNEYNATIVNMYPNLFGEAPFNSLTIYPPITDAKLLVPAFVNLS